MNRLQKLFIMFGLLIFSLVLQAQQPPASGQKKPEDETLRVETELVQIEVTVTDKEGKLVRDLKREDFILREDGKPQDIAYFSVGTATRPARWIGAEPKNKSAPTASPTTNTSESIVGRYIILTVDDFHISAGNLMRAKTSLTKFVEQQMGTGDYVGLITTSGQLGLFQQFTNDRDALKRAINRLAPQERKITNSFDVPRITDYQAELIDLGNQDALQLAVNEIMRTNPAFQNTGQNAGGGRRSTTQQTGFSPEEQAREQAKTQARMIVEQNSYYTGVSLQTLENVIRSLGALPGRKILALFSDGFFLGGNSSSKRFDVRKVTDAATRAGVVIYSLDARGLVGMPDSMDASQPGFGDEQPPGVRQQVENGSINAVQDGLFALAHDTGGATFFNSNDLNLGLQKILADTEMYYWLAFEPGESYRDGRFRKLEVRVKDHPEYKIRSSKGYFAPDDKAVAKAAEQEVKEMAQLNLERAKNPEKVAKKENDIQLKRAVAALGSLFPLRDIPLDLAADYLDVGRGEGLALITTHIDCANLKFEQSKEEYLATLEIVGTIFDERAKLVDTFRQKLNLQFKQARYDEVRKNGLVFNRRILLKPGFYQVRVAALKEGTKQTGSAADWVEIADLSKKQLTLSSIFLMTGNDPNLANVAVSQADNELTNAQKEQMASKPAQVARRFKSGANIDFTLFAYNGKRNNNGDTDLVVQSQVFSGSKVVFASPLTKMSSLTASNDANYVPYAARLSLADFEVGTYELRLLVIDRLTKTTAKRSINFFVEP